MSDGMMWKFPLDFEKQGDVFCMEMPKGARVLSLQTQGGVPMLWALVDPAKTHKPEKRWFRIAGTGHPIADVDSYTFIGTFQVMSGKLVFHVWEIPAHRIKENNR